MKKMILIAVVFTLAGLGAGRLFFSKPVQEPATGGDRKISYYRDPMNPQMTSPTPKKAADGMDYVPVYAEEPAKTEPRKIAYYKDPMHPWYTSDKPGKAPDCGMDLVPVYQDAQDMAGIRIDPNTVQNIGVTVAEVGRKSLNKTIRTSAVVAFDETRLYNINTKFMGWVEKLFVDYTGRPVHKGDPLLAIYSPDLVSTQEEYLQALDYRKSLARSTLAESLQAAEDLVTSARKRLEYWDIPAREISALEKGKRPERTLTIYSPANGIVLEKMVVEGQQVMPGMTLFKVADLSEVWVQADIYQFELGWIGLGQTAELELSYLSGTTMSGTVDYIYPYLNEETRTAKVRIKVRNTADFILKPGMFATVKIVSPVIADVIAVPEQAIIRSGERNIAVMALGGGYFDAREVRTGRSAGGYVEILDGIREGEKIVTSAQFLIDSESNLKAAISLMGGPSGSTSAAPPSQKDDSKDMDDMLKDLDMEDLPPDHDMKNMPEKKSNP